MDLLPQHHDEFRSKSYWDSFFAQRGDDAFEWYGSFRDLRALCLRRLSASARVLVLGCGNSAFSADLHDAGVRDVHSVDFSESVVRAMQRLNATRPALRWSVMDMTALDLPDCSCDAVVDKGALDALLSVDEPQLLQKAADMFAHISRVLVPGGQVRHSLPHSLTRPLTHSMTCS
jgi:SAM-dependent methyltransferase